jgi:hypothetical protein
VSLALCNSDCGCPVGSWCSPFTKKCIGTNTSGACYADCQCGGGYCVQGACSPNPPPPQCYNNCDCPRTHICDSNGMCQAWFSPAPECRNCDNHCWDQYGIYSYCENYVCKVWGP